MKLRQVKITDLPYELLSHIMRFVGESKNGAAEFVQATSVCKEFSKLAEDKEVLTLVNIEEMKLLPREELFKQNRNSLLIRCAVAGNIPARHMLAELILEAFSELHLMENSNENRALDRSEVFLSLDHGLLQLVGNKVTADFSSNLKIIRKGQFRRSRVTTSNPLPHSFLSQFMVRDHGMFHYQVVRLYLSQWRLIDIDLSKMSRYLVRYVRHLSKSIDHFQFVHFIIILARSITVLRVLEQFMRSRDRVIEFQERLPTIISQEHVLSSMEMDSLMDEYASMVNIEASLRFNLYCIDIDYKSFIEGDFTKYNRYKDNLAEKVDKLLEDLISFLDNLFLNSR